MRIPLTLSIYIGKHFLIGVSIVFALLTSLILIFDSLEIIRRSHGKGVPFSIIFEMVLMKAPTIILEVIAFAILLGGIVCFSRITRSSELIVARAAGISAWQFLAPAIIISFLFGIFIITVINPLAAVMLSRFEHIEAKYIHGNTSMLSVSSTGLWLRQNNEHNGGKIIIHALRVDSKQMKLHDVTFYDYKENNAFYRRIDADSAILRVGFWDISNASILVPSTIIENKPKYRIKTNLSINQIQESFAPPKTISFWALPKFIKTLKEAGFSAQSHSLHWHTILVTPFLFGAMVLFAAVFSLRPPRRGKTGLLMAGGILAGFTIRFLSDLVAAIGLSGSIPIIMAAWTPVFVSILIGTALILHLEDG